MSIVSGWYGAHKWASYRNKLQYKLEKEAFVANLEGTYLLEISFLISVYAFAYLFQRLFLQNICHPETLPLLWLVEYLTLCLPFLLACTWLNGYIYYICSILFTGSLLIVRESLYIVCECFYHGKFGCMVLRDCGMMIRGRYQKWSKTAPCSSAGRKWSTLTSIGQAPCS